MKSSKKPFSNILFILSDDQGAWAMGCAGNNEIETPNLDRLAAAGMRFDNFFCASPVCSPARATLLTGRI
ncbi:MAG: sulfatase-like hydrolase/transferase, partial [Candidatus Pacebacteria bacterium]|nr:sulfatase-like hydrolase/transferase [Candidatus Paceibacterota bacterium]